MADVRINALSTTATSAASDDYLALDGSANGTRKILATNIAQNVTDVTFGSGGPSAKSSIAARAARQGLVFDGTAGGTIANAATIGTADFTIAVWMNLRSTAGSQFILTNSIGTSNFQTSVTDLVMYRSTGSTIATSTSPLVANKTQLIVYTRSGTTGQFYVNGVAFEGTKTDANSYTTFSDIGGVGSSSPLNGTLIPFIYNRALSAAEVVSLYESGVPSGADYGASGVPASNTSIVTGANSDFSSDTGYWTKGNGATISGGKCNLTGGTYANIFRSSIMTSGKKFRIVFTVSTADAALYISDGGVTSLAAGISGTGTKTVEVTGGPAGGIQIVSPAGTAVIDDLLIYPIGLLLAPDAAQAGGGLTWYDTSGNAANITLPASGVTWNVPTSGKMATSLTVNGGTLTVNNLGSSSAVINATQSASTGYSYLELKNTGGTAQTWQLGLGGSGIGGLAQQIYAYDQTANAVRFSVSTSGNFLLKGDGIDSANGKLQLATHTTSAGGIGFGTDTSFNRIAAGKLALTDSGSTPTLSLYASSTERVRIEASGASAYISTVDASASLYLRSGNLTTALTLDSSQNATFAGNVAIQSGNALRLNNPSNSGYASIYMDASNIINFNYTAAFGVTIRTQGGTASTPASASATGVAGTIQWDANYIYVCTAANTWKRAAIATW